MDIPQGTIATPKITGVYAFRPLEAAAWLLLASLFFVAALGHHAGESRCAQTPIDSWRMDLNAAPLEELLTLPGMTSRRARAIISAREKRGGFERVSDISSVPGITNAYLHRIETMVDAKK